MNWLTTLRGEIPKNYTIPLMLGGMGALLLLWFLLSLGSSPLIPSYALPSPQRVFLAYGDLYRDNELIRNTFLSISLNLGGYIKAILWSIPIGFLIGLFPVSRGSFQPLIDAIRFLPLTALTSLFLVWFGIGSEMKINFLAFGIFIYLLPTVIARIDDVDDVYVKTVFTLGATKWQTIKSVFIPAVVSKLSDDIRVLTAISWTYIIVAETTASQGGLGPLTFASQRVGRVDKIFAILLLILFIGVIQDRIFVYLDRKFFPYKYQTKPGFEQENFLKKNGYMDVIMDFTFKVLGILALIIYIVLMINELNGFLLDFKVFDYFFSDRQWTVHFLFALFIVYKGYDLFKKYVKA